MLAKVEASFEKLRMYCENANFTGWDPFDGLNSKVFRKLPFIRDNRLARLAWIQLFKRSPLNLRKVAMVPKGENPKGLGLFLNAYCNLYKMDPREEYLDKIRMLADRLIQLRTPGYSGACWGYNFDWQSKAFFQPKYTPTIVASTFIGYALLDAFDITGYESYKSHGLSVCDFILRDLNRTYDNDGDFAFSYSPLDHTQVFNASLLGARMLARGFSYSGNISYLEPSRRAVSYCCKHQRRDGSWAYSTLPFHQWTDSFHTGFNLECISEYQKYSGDNYFMRNIELGHKYYLANFFTGDGIPRYYNNATYPIDVHATAQLIITMARLGRFREYAQVADSVLGWTIDHMQSKRGYFFYQKWNWFYNRIPYMRWSQAWMFFAMSMYLLEYKKPVTGKINGVVHKSVSARKVWQQRN